MRLWIYDLRFRHALRSAQDRIQPEIKNLNRILNPQSQMTGTAFIFTSRTVCAASRRGENFGAVMLWSRTIAAYGAQERGSHASGDNSLRRNRGREPRATCSGWAGRWSCAARAHGVGRSGLILVEGRVEATWRRWGVAQQIPIILAAMYRIGGLSSGKGAGARPQVRTLMYAGYEEELRDCGSVGAVRRACRLFPRTRGCGSFWFIPVDSAHCNVARRNQRAVAVCINDRRVA